MIQINKKNNKFGFTLVELLAVIVILAIILVIAVPKVMSVIEDAKKATLESTAKMIASQAEKQKVQNTVLGKTEEITCESVAKINDKDYASCSITFEDNRALVTIEGSNKFEGLYVCDGTKIEAVATDEECSSIDSGNNNGSSGESGESDNGNIGDAGINGSIPLKFGEKYVVTTDNLGVFTDMIFYADGSAKDFGDDSNLVEAGYFIYTETEIQFKKQIEGQKLLISSDGITLTMTLQEQVVAIWTLESHVPEPTIISFTIDGKSYQAEEGMTWLKWISSDYSNGEYEVVGINVSVKAQNSYIHNGDDRVTYDLKIISANNYNLAAIGT